MATSTRTALPVARRANDTIPPLRIGDHLTAAEFERRYQAMPDLKKAELIEGVVHLGSPVSEDHGPPHFDMITWLGFYRTMTPGVVGSDNGTARLDPDNRPQPDIQLRITPDCGGRARVSEDRYIVGAPELVIEIAASSVSYDLHEKLHAYRRNEVFEYVVWRVEDRAIDWLVLREGRYVPLVPNSEGLLKSEAFPGLWLDPAALFAGEMAQVLAVAQQGIASPEHAAFVERLRAEAARLLEATPPPQQPQGDRP